MLTKRHLERYADVLWWGLTTARTTSFKKNDIILIRYNQPAIQLAEVLYAKHSWLARPGRSLASMIA